MKNLEKKRKTWQVPVVDLRKMALSAAYGRGPSVALFPSVKCFFPVEMLILKDPKQISFVSKSERGKINKKVFCHPHLLHWGPSLWPNCLHNFSFFGGTWFSGGPENNILGGPCQQLLTLLTLISATGVQVCLNKFGYFRWYQWDLKHFTTQANLG